MDKQQDAINALIETINLVTSESTKNRTRFAQGLKAEARSLWSGVTTQSEFENAMTRIVERGLKQAWNKGFMDYGIAPDEQADDERQYIFNYTLDQWQYIDGLASFIADNSRANKGKLKDINARIDLWIRRYDTIYNEAKARAAGNQKLEWVLGVAEHCSSCVKLNGQVRRGSFWIGNGILPAVPNADYLECKGYKCKCTLQPTSKRMSRGPLPRLP